MAGIFQPLFIEPASHIYRFLVNEDYRTFSILWSRLQKIRRFTECQVKTHDWDLSIPDAASFLSAYKDIFVERIYSFKADTSSPKILDLGANIGLSVLFFKYLYPQARIIAFEADPNIYRYLQKNVHGNGYTDVQLINKAVWHEYTTLRFCSEGADGGRVAQEGDEKLVDVDAIDLAHFIGTNNFDFLKMDIEGAEEFCLPAIADQIGNFRFVFVEYHSVAKREQGLDKIINVLSGAGFRIHLQSILCSPSPFVQVKLNSGFDLQLNIFAWKE